MKRLLKQAVQAQWPPLWANKLLMVNVEDRNKADITPKIIAKIVFLCGFMGGKNTIDRKVTMVI